MQLMAHQIKGVEFLVKNKGVGALYWEVGCGKTIGSLATYLYFKEKEPTLKLVIICPLSLIEGAWIKEIEKFAPGLKWLDLHGLTSNFYISNRANQSLLHESADVLIINFEYLISQQKFEGLTNMLANREVMCIIDESSKMKNYQAKTTERILYLSRLFKYRCIMSGTPAPNIEWEYWAQMCFLSPKILGDNFYKFKNVYFQLKRGNQVAPGAFMNKAALRELLKTGFKYELNPKKRVQMLEQMRPYCDFVKARDCMDLPEEIDEFRVIEMNEKHRKAYNSMKEQYVLELKNEAQETSGYAVANLALTKFMKLRQITSGFVIDDQGVAQALHVDPKMDALLDVVEECGDQQMIIWGNFHYEIDLIAYNLKKFGGVSMLYGEVEQSDRINQINDFLSGKNRFLVAHPRSAGHGLTFTNCHIQLFYSLTYSYEEYTQARGRTMRYGQKNNCLYFHLICKNSIDEDVLAIVQKKANAQSVAEKYLKG